MRRPSYEELAAELDANGFEAVGRQYGVSGNAIRKWVRQYERDGPEAYGTPPARDEAA